MLAECHVYVVSDHPLVPLKYQAITMGISLMSIEHSLYSLRIIAISSLAALAMDGYGHVAFVEIKRSKAKNFRYAQSAISYKSYD